ncbi:MAG: efflux RND transporter periplasmic adaptor subunit [Dermatophilaceae bacterium]
MRFKALALKGRSVIVGVGVTVLVVGGVGSWAATRSSSSDAAAPTLVSATTSTIRQTVSATGTLEPAHRADLSFLVSGTVTSLPVAVGDRVTVGTVLATVDSATLQTAVTVVQANVTATQDQLTAQQNAGSSAVQIASAQAQLASAQSRLADAKTALAAASMTSPIAGTVAQINIATGDKVGNAASSSAQIVVISTTSWVVEASVGSADLPQLKKGLQVEITPTGSTTKVFGTVKSVGIVASSSSTGSASFPVTIAVTGSPKGLYAGGAATVSIIVKQVENVLTVPTSALHTENGRTVVHQMVNGAQVSTLVTVGTTYGVVTQILSGLKTGDEVVGTTFRVGGTNPAGGTRTRQTGGTGGTGGGGTGGRGFGGFGGGSGGSSSRPPASGGGGNG